MIVAGYNKGDISCGGWYCGSSFVGQNGCGRGHWCSTCGLSNHARETCWDLVGRPPHFAYAMTSTRVDPPPSSISIEEKIMVVSKDEYFNPPPSLYVSLLVSSLALQGTPVACSSFSTSQPCAM